MSFERRFRAALVTVACALLVPAAALASQPAGPVRPPDVRDAAVAATSAAGAPRISIESPVRPPDVSDAAEAARWTSPDTPAGFGWWDYAAGIGTGIGLVALAVALLAIRRLSSRHRLQTA